MFVLLVLHKCHIVQPHFLHNLYTVVCLAIKFVRNYEDSIALNRSITDSSMFCTLAWTAKFYLIVNYNCLVLAICIFICFHVSFICVRLLCMFLYLHKLYNKKIKLLYC